MRVKIAAVSLSLAFAAAVCLVSAASPAPAQVAITQPGFSSINCSGFVTDQKIPEDLRLVSGEQSDYKITFSRGDYVYLNRGQDKGLKIGDRFSVIRAHTDPLRVPWFKWQEKLMRAMGTAYYDTGELRVVNVQPKVSIAEVSLSCGYMQRGDIVLPYADRPAPPYKDAGAFDHFAPVSGKPVAMVVAGVDWAQTYGKFNTVYVNLGTDKGVKIGDYFRIFRYEGKSEETAPQTPGYQYAMYGFGSAPQRYAWNDLPRELLGEGIVFNVSRNSSTMLITFASSEIYAGDYVEIE